MAASAVAPTVASPALAELPDDRAYEQVSPTQKNGGDAVIAGAVAGGNAFVADEAGRLIYNSFGTFADAPSGYLNQYLAERTPTGWRNRSVTPAQGELPNFPDFTIGMLRFGCGPCSQVLGQFPWAPVAGDTNGVNDVYAFEDGQWRWISQGSQPNLAGATAPISSSDGGVVGFGSPSVLEPEAAGTTPGNSNAYVRVGARTHVVALDDSEQLLTAGGSRIGGAHAFGGVWNPRAISADGSRVFFEAPIDGSSQRNVYVREDGESTKRLDSPRCAGGGGCVQTGDSSFRGAARDGSKLFFASPAQLVDEDTDTLTDLYEYDLETDEPRRVVPEIGGFTILSPLQGLSEDGNVLYVTSEAVLTAVPNARGQLPVAGEENTYAVRPGASPPERFKFVGGGDGPAGSELVVTGVSPSGRYAAFRTTADLGAPTAGTLQWYLYDSVADELRCVSCGAGTPQSVAENDPAAGPTDAGELVFSTTAPLDPRDDNGLFDAYLWEAGQAYLLTTGHGSNLSAVVGISKDGRDVYFATSDRLLPSDRDDNQDVYTARRGGGFPYEPPPPPCAAEECQPPPAGRLPVTPVATVDFSGRGDARPARRLAAVRASVRRRAVRNGAFAVRVVVPKAGRVTVRGSGIRAAARRFHRAGGHRIALRLTRPAARRLRASGRLRVTVRLDYRPKGGGRSSTRLVTTLED